MESTKEFKKLLSASGIKKVQLNYCITVYEIKLIYYWSYFYWLSSVPNTSWRHLSFQEYTHENLQKMSEKVSALSTEIEQTNKRIADFKELPPSIPLALEKIRLIKIETETVEQEFPELACVSWEIRRAAFYLQSELSDCNIHFCCWDQCINRRNFFKRAVIIDENIWILYWAAMGITFYWKDDKPL